MNPKFVPKESAPAETQSCFMVVDDNHGILNVTRAMLTGITNAPVECYASPTEALAAFQAAPQKYALVITDFDMPGMTGAELCHHLRSLSPGVKVLLVTGSGMAGQSTAMAMGFCGLLRKPFMIGDLEDAVVNAGFTGNRIGDLFHKESTSLMLA